MFSLPLSPPARRMHPPPPLPSSLFLTPSPCARRSRSVRRSEEACPVRAAVGSMWPARGRPFHVSRSGQRGRAGVPPREVGTAPQGPGRAGPQRPPRGAAGAGVISAAWVPWGLWGQTGDSRGVPSEPRPAGTPDPPRPAGLLCNGNTAVLIFCRQQRAGELKGAKEFGKRRCRV